ncbi:hypothetical protein SAMN05216359_11776 [Roseateles sp. YR242]|uniref:hypothetical protein n=1 Tax=Roseateles sp. YR242 TaxID=1855305 RepID=UPI0008AE6FDA|nr:hypothetical protein [Roseateles sp. YR242]SEL80185.1 hypothetical protein SAMN05216359_11776 [Roseateles sp. YR242]
MPTPPPTPAGNAAANDMAPRLSDSQWGEIVQQLGAEIAGPLSGALERIQELISTGQIDRQGLRALREAVVQAREAGMVTQQLSRLASGRLRLSRERVHLTQVLRGVLTQRSRETQARGIQVRQLLQPIEIMTDGSLLFSLLNAVMDWALTNTHSSLEMRLDLTPWPTKARLVCRFAHRSLDLGSAPTVALSDTPEALNSLTWRLIEQTALTIGALPLREDEAGITLLTLEFPHIVNDDDPRLQPAPTPIPAPSPAPPLQERDEVLPSHNSKPLAGCHLLIVSPRKELRQQIQEAIRHMGLIIDAVGSMDEALAFCEDGLPHGIAFEHGLHGPDFDRLHADITAEVPSFSFIEVRDGEQQTQLSTATPDRLARISRANLGDALPSVLLFELSKAI